MRIIYISKSTMIKIFTVLVVIVVSITYSFGGGPELLNVFLNAQKEIPIYSVETKDKKVALTFEASFGADYSDQILDILNKNNVKATFFVVGEWANKNQEKVKRMFELGHEIGNHSNSHVSLTDLNSEQAAKEILGASEQIKQITGYTTNIFRLPFGEYNTDIIKTINKTNHNVIQWDVDSMDRMNVGKEVVYNNVINKVDRGSIVLFHNNTDITPMVLKSIISKLSSMGYSFVRISDLIYKNDYYIDHTGRQRRVD